MKKMIILLLTIAIVAILLVGCVSTGSDVNNNVRPEVSYTLETEDFPVTGVY